MLLKGLGVTRAQRAVVVLGAGASRGASFATADRQVLPPLDADFFVQAQRLDDGRYAAAAKEVMSFIREEYGPARLPTLESLFTQLTAHQRFLQQFFTGKGRKTTLYRRQLRALEILIPTVFRSAFANQRCTWHDRIAYALRSGDAVISFNYDTVIDEALTSLREGNWDASVGYGFAIRDGRERWTAPQSPGPLTASHVRLLKPHGSLHWRLPANGAVQAAALASDPYELRAASGNIIPPTWDKEALNGWPWRDVWKEASRLLQQARCLIVIGYSVPQTDQLSQALIKSSLSTAGLRLLVVVNPDRLARAKVVELARSAITAETRIIELNALSDFGRLLEATPEQRRRSGEMGREIQAIRRVIRDLDTRTDELEDRTDDLVFTDVADLERRVEELESLPDLSDRLDELQTSLETLTFAD